MKFVVCRTMGECEDIVFAPKDRIIAECTSTADYRRELLRIIGQGYDVVRDTSIPGYHLRSYIDDGQTTIAIVP
jgi:hypothetical protein